MSSLVPVDQLLVQRRFKLSARVSSDNLSAIKPVLQKFAGGKGSVEAIEEGFGIKGQFTGESARDLNRMLLSEMR